jgi:hypothetical protein
VVDGDAVALHQGARGVRHRQQHVELDGPPVDRTGFVAPR